MALLEIKNLGISFGGLRAVDDFSVTIEKGQLYGLIGPNGAGKTTIFNLLTGVYKPNMGTIQLDGMNITGKKTMEINRAGVARTFQNIRLFKELTVLDNVKAGLHNQYSYSTVAGILRLPKYFKVEKTMDEKAVELLKVFDLDKEKDYLASNLPYGKQRKLEIARALATNPKLLLLDEPTNHLDIHMIEWLEGFLKNYSGGVLIISHDRYFLDRVATRILELAGCTVTNYDGNYTYYMKVKTERRAALQSAYEKQQEHIKKTEEYIRKYKAGIKSKQARGRQSQLNRLERIVLPPEDASFNYFALNKPPECAERVAELEDVSMAFSSRKIFDHISMLIRRGDGVALVGPNGAGKTTLLRVLVGELESPTGRVKIGSRVKIGYFSQQHEGLHMDNTILDELIYEYGINEEQARRYLGAFLFHGDEVLRRIGDLSGGEQSRVAFLKLMLTGANFLVLDEPTNHLDIPAREAVEEALMAFPGTFLAVSHDRYFLDKVANCTLELENGKLTEYLGNYSYYLMKKELAEAEAREEREAAEKEHEREKEAQAKHHVAEKKPAERETRQTAAANEAAEKRREEEKKRAEIGRIQSMSDAKREEMVQRAEAEIAMAEAELKGLEFQMNDPAIQADPQQSQAIAEAYAAKEKEIEMRYEKWERLTEA